MATKEREAEEKKIRETMEKDAEKLKEAVLTPMEKFRQLQESSRQLFEEGLIDKTTFDRSKRKDAEERLREGLR